MTDLKVSIFVTGQRGKADCSLCTRHVMDNQDAVVHRLFLIRHGETIDNVAGLYAGHKDSALTNHGVQQAARLAQHFVQNEHCFTHIFSSDLSRAFKTAEAVRTAQRVPSGDDDEEHPVKTTVQLPMLREQAYGYYEGKPFHARKLESTKNGKELNRDKHWNEPGFQDVESRESMSVRGDAFLDKYLLPLLVESKQSLTIAVVSHGMLLSSLWRCILRRQLHKSITINPEIVAETRPVSLEHLGGWANTGYLELELSPSKTRSNLNGTSVQATKLLNTAPSKDAVLEGAQTNGSDDANVDESTKSVSDTTVHQSSEAGARIGSNMSTFAILIKAINCREHLRGLKRTGGGVGSSKHDEGQKSIESFFKRRKTKV